jgi:hypothetical protein
MIFGNVDLAGDGDRTPNGSVRIVSTADVSGGSARRRGEAIYVGERIGDAMVDMTGGPPRELWNTPDSLRGPG